MNLTRRALALLGTLLLLSISSTGLLFAQTQTLGLESSIVNQMKLPEQPKALAHSLDGKLLFILTYNNEVLVYNQTGQLEGTIPVPRGVNDIDIAPRGDLLFLINEEEQTHTVMTVDFIKEIKVGASPYLGLENAPVVLTIFTDFQ